MSRNSEDLLMKAFIISILLIIPLIVYGHNSCIAPAPASRDSSFDNIEQFDWMNP